MKTIKLVTIIVVILILTGGFRDAYADDVLKISTTLSTYADIAQTIGGTHVDASAVASPHFNPHFIEPRPSDVLRVKRADLFIHSGLDLEAWRDPLLNAAGRVEFRVGGDKQLDLSTRIRLLQVPDRQLSRAEGDIHLFGNPHYWTDPRNGLVIAQEIAEKLIAADPEHVADYRANLAAFEGRLKSKITEWDAAIAPFRGREFVGYHNEWVYLMDYLGLKMTQYLEPKPGIPPSPQQIEFISTYIREKKIAGIIQATFSPREAGEAISERTGVKVLVLAQSVHEIDQATDYISTIDYDIHHILSVLK